MSKQHPITNNGRTDERYSVRLEYCGHEKPHYVVRFCGEWIGQSQFYGSALMLASGHNARRNGALVIEALNIATPQPDPNESRIRAVNDISQYAALSEEQCAALGIEF